MDDRPMDYCPGFRGQNRVRIPCIRRGLRTGSRHRNRAVNVPVGYSAMAVTDLEVPAGQGLEFDIA